MTTSFLLSGPDPVLTSVQTLCILLDVTERRVQQLAEEGIVVRRRQGQYDLVASIQGYVRYLRAQARKKARVFSVEDFESALAGIEVPIE